MIEEMQTRLARLQAMRDAGIDPFPSTTQRTHTVAEFLRTFETQMSSQTDATLVGRIRLIRTHGGLTFCHLQDGSGLMQIVFRKDHIGEIEYKQFLQMIDIGDFVQCTGKAFVTKKGEQSLDIFSYRSLAKALLPLPEKWHGLSDVETRFRKRYLDLIMNSDVRDRLLTRSKIIAAIRNLLDERGFIEVETPTLQPVYGGGFARPFKTHHNALDADFYLRISDEMYLKRLIVGGFEKVYEITKVFRNEGIDRDHNPEFTMFEAQIAYQNYFYGMDLFEEIFEHSVKQSVGKTQVRHGEILVELARPWKRIRLIEAVEKIGEISKEIWNDEELARLELKKRLSKDQHENIARMKSVGELMAFAFEELVEEKLVQPTIVYDYPVEVSPLAKKSVDPRFVERFEAFALGSEIGNNYSELNDPVDLEKRFIAEKAREEAGFEEAHQTDFDYLEAIQHGMPPTFGLGIGIDRMVMLLTGAENIKEVILFPTLRPEVK
ncbi:lysine--tRNA ligase [Candidatus Uhrbacteria bacterium]|nr:lysine--tRNA ligase [Candidatus Uhrbacteria bacterium]